MNPKTLSAADAERVLGKGIEREYKLADLLRRPEVRYADLMSLHTASGGSFVADDLLLSGGDEFSRAVVEQVEIQIKYAGYIARQQEDVLRQERYEELSLPQAMDYLAVRGLSIEVGQKLNKHRPETLGQASRISGVTPAALSLLLVHLKRGDWRGLDLDHAEPKAPDFETSKSRAA